ncbi:MAG: hypothetical protein OFPII_30720 [Osedax symbiont Rs1]|nr:MAG: hypothetical protein OFPII_30720 [Osedax symbiont Rs1]
MVQRTTFFRRIKQIGLLVLLAAMVSGCATYRPASTSNLCSIFRGNIDWYKDARAATKKWGTPMPVMMAIMQQESNFKDDARPGYKYFLWVIPAGRISSAYGYSQALNGVWGEYKKSTGNRWADRDDFDDAIDFIGWYTTGTQRMTGVSKWDAYGQYLAYHEGRGGYKRKSYNKKPWLLEVAKKVKRRASSYTAQLKSCKSELDNRTSGWLG